MNEPLLEEISQLKRSVKCWKLVSLGLALCLVLLLLLAVAIGSIFIAVPATQELPWRARAREAEDQARQNEMKARQALETLEAERRAAKEREKAAKKEP
jgi:hypothetical protein